jgi:hypothetical protein
MVLQPLQRADGREDDEELPGLVARQRVGRAHPHGLELLGVRRPPGVWPSGMRATRKGTSKRRGRSRSVTQCASTYTSAAASVRPRACIARRRAPVRSSAAMSLSAPAGRPSAWRASSTPSSSKLSRMAAMAWVRCRSLWRGRRAACAWACRIGGVDAAAREHIGAGREAGGHGAARHQHLDALRAVAQQQHGGGGAGGGGFALRVQQLRGSDHACIIGSPMAGVRRDNSVMRVRFTKMQGAGNDFVVLDETRGPLGLTREQYRHLGDRHFGVGADQILVVARRPAPMPTSATASTTPTATRSSIAATARAASCASCTTRA